MPLVTVRVTGTDVRRGLPGHPLRCPVARAMQRATGWSWVVSRCSLWPLEAAEDRRVPMPQEAAGFVRDYDHGRKVRPFAFTLDVPDGWLFPPAPRSGAD